jgi:hypothetical protein
MERRSDGRIETPPSLEPTAKGERRRRGWEEKSVPTDHDTAACLSAVWMGTQYEIQGRDHREDVIISVFGIADQVSMCIRRLTFDDTEKRNTLLQAIDFDGLYIFDGQCILFHLLFYPALVILLKERDVDGERLR